MTGGRDGVKQTMKALPRARRFACAALIGACAALAQACRPAEPPVEPEVAATAGLPPSQLDLSAIEWQPGARVVELAVADRGSRSAEIWIPNAPAPRSLIIVLHGTVSKAQRETASQAQTHGLVGCLAAPAFTALDPIIIAPHSATGQWWRPDDTGFVLGLVEAAKRRWPELAPRSVISGYSNGGLGAWYFARLYPEYFVAAIPMAFNDTIVGASPLPIYAIQGTKDEQFEIGPVRAAVRALKARGQDVTFHEKYRGTHLAACSYVAELTQAARWLASHAFPRAGHGAP
jgi:poly(3-hydroxybutyrate) depolymerase